MLTRLERNATKLLRTELDWECFAEYLVMVRGLVLFHDEETWKVVLPIDSLLDRENCSREFVTQNSRDRHSVRYSGKFVILGVCYDEIRLYLKCW